MGRGVRAPPPPQPVPPASFRAAPSALNREAADMPAASSMPSATVSDAVGPSGIVIRPTGLRHGRWEAPGWAFWTMGALVVVLAIFYALGRLGYIRKKAG